MKDKEISLIDLMAHILSHWRGILICILVGAILMGGFSYVKSYRQAGEALGEQQRIKNKTPEERLQRLEKKLSESEKIAIYTLIDDEQEYAIYQQYVESSVLMQMDPYSIPTIDMLFKIQTDDIEQSYILKSIYEDLTGGVGMLQWMEENTGISSASVDELITVSQDKSNTPARDYFKVSVIHYDEVECERLAQCVKDYIEQQNEKLTLKWGAHEVIVLSESAGIVMNTDIRDRQLQYSNREISFLTNFANAKNTFTEDQQLYYELLKDSNEISEEEGEPETEVEQVIEKPSISMKYVALGALLFAFVYVGILFVIYIFNDKLRFDDELQGLYNISQLGLIVKDEGKKKLFIDKWIDTLRNWSRRRFTREQSLELAVAAIKISAGKQELDTICLMGCELKAGADIVCQELKERLEKESITVKVLDNVLYDAERMEELSGVKGVVLVEKAMSTMHNEILRELELVSCQDIKVLGGIVVE